MITLTYTQHTVAFPSNMRPTGETDSVNVSLDYSEGGTDGEFSWRFVAFSQGDPAVQLTVFGDGLSCYFDARVQEAVQRWREMPDPDKMTPEQLCGFLRDAGAVPGRYMPEEGTEARPFTLSDEEEQALDYLSSNPLFTDLIDAARARVANQ